MPDPRELVLELYLRFAQDLADAAGEAIRPWFRVSPERMGLERKGDGSPVTKADRAAEAVIREMIADRYPTHGVIGEEYGAEAADSEFVWAIDPIDGTGAFISGLPTFGTLIGLLRDGSPVLGVLDQPISGERWCGVSDPGVMRRSTHNARVIHSHPRKTLAHSTVFATTPDMFQGEASHAWQRLAGAVERVRYGADCYAYGLLAMGQIEMVCEADLKPWDYLALVPIVEGAGGKMTDWTGAQLTLDSGDQVLATCSQELHRTARRCLQAPAGDAPATR